MTQGLQLWCKNLPCRLAAALRCGLQVVLIWTCTTFASYFILFFFNAPRKGRSGQDSISGLLKCLPFLIISTHLWHLCGCLLTWPPLISIVTREQRNLPWRNLVSKHSKVYEFWSSVQKTRASRPQMLRWWENNPASLRHIS